MEEGYGDQNGSKIAWGSSNTNLTFDTWHSIEVEIQLNTPGLNDGWIRTWINGVLYPEMNQVNVNTRGSSTLLFSIVNIGDQVNRYNYGTVDEYRYWDDIVISDAFVKP